MSVTDTVRSLRNIIDLLGASTESFSTAQLATPVQGIAVESSKISSGFIFVALPGEHTHGAHFVADALSRGAIALITDEEGARISSVQIPLLKIENTREMVGTLSSFVYGDPSASMQVVAVTGTNGKTTVTSLLERKRNIGWGDRNPRRALLRPGEVSLVADGAHHS